MPPKELERQTRRQRINPRLQAAGWRIVGDDAEMPLGSHDYAVVEEFETRNGPADYALCSNARVLGVVEAKKLTLGPQGVLSRPSGTRRALTDGPAVSRRVRRAVPLLHERRGDLVPRRPASTQSLASGRRLPHAGGAGRDDDTRTSTPSLRRCAAVPAEPHGMRPYQVEANTAIEQAIARAQAQDARDHGHRHRQDAHDWSTRSTG